MHAGGEGNWQGFVTTIKKFITQQGFKENMVNKTRMNELDSKIDSLKEDMQTNMQTIQQDMKAIIGLLRKEDPI